MDFFYLHCDLDLEVRGILSPNMKIIGPAVSEKFEDYYYFIFYRKGSDRFVPRAGSYSLLFFLEGKGHSSSLCPVEKAQSPGVRI